MAILVEEQQLYYLIDNWGYVDSMPFLRVFSVTGVQTHSLWGHSSVL